MDPLLWEVQTLAANLEPAQLLEIRDEIRARLGSDFSDEIIDQWRHELAEED